MIDLVSLILNAKTPLADGGVFSGQIDRSRRQLMVSGAPGDLLTVRTQAGTAAGDL